MNGIYFEWAVQLFLFLKKLFLWNCSLRYAILCTVNDVSQMTTFCYWHEATRPRKFYSTLANMSRLILATCSRMDFLNLFKVQGSKWYTYALRYPHEKRSNVLKSVDREGNNLLTTLIEAFIVYGVTLNDTYWAFLLILWKMFQSLKLTATPSSKKLGPMTSPW